MYKFLLFLHFIGFTIIIGAAVYDRFYIVRNIRMARDSSLEKDLIRIYLSTGTLYGIGAALLLFSGIGLTILTGEGFFKPSALGVKQSLFLAIGLLFPIYIIPLMLKIDRLLNTMPGENAVVSDRCRSLLERLYWVLDTITIASVLILAIAIWKPDLHQLGLYSGFCLVPDSLSLYP
jgi:uncharacterized membrane protein